MEELKEKFKKSVTIDECTEGYILKEGGTDNMYAVTKDSLTRKIKELLSITEKKFKKKIPEKKDTSIRYSIIDPIRRPMSAIETEKINDDLKNNKVKIVTYNKFSCEKFDITNLSAKKAGKSTYWVSNEKVCIQREGYVEGLRVYITLADLRYLYEHPDEIKNVNKTRRYHITGFLKDVDVSTLSGSEVSEKEPEQESEPEEPKQEPEKPKLEFFHEDTGFDYMAVQPKQVGRVQVYSNNGKVVIKLAREIVLTSEVMIEKLLQYDEKDLTASLRGINAQKQNILRVYLIELKKRST